MKTIVKAFTCRLYPTKRQAQQLQQTFGCVRFVYNQLLSAVLARKSLLSVAKHFYPSKVDLVKSIPYLKDQFPFLKEVDSISLQASAEDLADGFSRFFSKQNGFPTFKKRKSRKRYTTKCVNNNIRFVSTHKITVPKIGTMRLKNSFGSVLETANIQRITIRQEPTGHYYVSILVKDVSVQPLQKTNATVGLDMGITHFVADSNGIFFNAPNALRIYEEKLKKAQRVLSRRIERALQEKRPIGKGKNIQKARQRVARIHAKIANIRKNFLHQLTTTLVRTYDVIVLESLSIKEMMQDHHLAKQIANASWSMFKIFLQYKADWYGKTVQLVHPAYTSQMCHVCKQIDKKNRNGTHFTCTNCGHTTHADTNAAKNILDAGMQLL